MIVIGIDASTTSTGYGVFQDKELIDYGRIRPKGDAWRERLPQLAIKIKAVIEKHPPDKIYMEDVPLMGRRLETLVILGAVQGLMLGLCASLNVPIEFLYPSSWRSGIGLFDGTKQGTKKDEMKQKAVLKANQLFDLDLKWVAPKSVKNEDDVAEGILIAWSQVAMKPRLLKKKKL